MLIDCLIPVRNSLGPLGLGKDPQIANIYLCYLLITYVDVSLWYSVYTRNFTNYCGVPVSLQKHVIVSDIKVACKTHLVLSFSSTSLVEVCVFISRREVVTWLFDHKLLCVLVCVNCRASYLEVHWNQLMPMVMQLLMWLSIIGSQCLLDYLIWHQIQGQRSEAVHWKFCLIYWMREVASSHHHFGKASSIGSCFPFLIM